MNHPLKKLSLLFSCATFFAAHADTVTPFYSIRSQGVDAARELAGWTHHINLYDKEKTYGSFATTFQYSHSFKSKDILNSMLGTCDTCPAIVVSGSNATNRGAQDWLADYFYLPTDFKSNLSFNPTIDNFIVDLDLYVGLEDWLEGLFFRLHLPVVHTRWNLDYCETVNFQGNSPYFGGYFAANEIPTAALLSNFSQYAAGETPASIPGTIMNPLRYAKFNAQRHTDTKLAELQAVLGWNFLQNEDYHVGLGVRFSAPTGTKPKGELLFEPLAGNGRHWELGGQFTSHYTFWRSENDEHTLGAYVDANVTHLFKAKQVRTFDLKCKPMSRYMLAEKLGTPVVNLAGGATAAAAIIPSAQFQNEYTPVANLTTASVKVSAAVQADIVAQVTYAYKGFNWDLGYDFWYRSCEKFDRSCKCPSLPENTWALKGVARVYGVDSYDTEILIPLSATQSQATIHGGQSTSTNPTMMVDPNTNPTIDNPQLAWNGADSAADMILWNPEENQINTSINPLFISANDIDYVGVRGLSNKIYSHLSYQWCDHKYYVPFVGVGAFAEFGSPYNQCSDDCSSANESLACPSSTSACPSSSSTCPSSTSACADNSSCATSGSCAQAALSQWGVWLKTGVSF